MKLVCANFQTQGTIWPPAPPSQHEHKVLIVSSGGPIATAVGQVLGTSAETTIELNLRIRNSAVSEFAFTPKRHMLQSFNHLPHLDAVERRGWVSYS